MASFFSALSYSFDMFKLPITFSFFSKPKHSTVIGTLISIAILSILFLVFFTSNFYLKINPTISAFSLQNEPRPNQYFGANNFSFFIQMRRASNGAPAIDPSAYTLVYKQIGLNLKTMNPYYYYEEELRLCTIENFPDNNTNKVLINYTNF